MTKMLTRATRYDRLLLREGTSAGPVTEEMIAWAKTKYVEACRRFGERPSRHGWHDFLPGAREEFAVGGWLHDQHDQIILDENGHRIPANSAFLHQPPK